jgi:hypothetical protein
MVTRVITYKQIIHSFCDDKPISSNDMIHILNFNNTQKAQPSTCSPHTTLYRAHMNHSMQYSISLPNDEQFLFLHKHWQHYRYPVIFCTVLIFRHRSTYAALCYWPSLVLDLLDNTFSYIQLIHTLKMMMGLHIKLYSRNEVF